MVCGFHRWTDCPCSLHWCTRRWVSLPHVEYPPPPPPVCTFQSCSPSLSVCPSSINLHFTITFFLFVPFIVELQDYKPPQKICGISCAKCEAHGIVSGFRLCCIYAFVAPPQPLLSCSAACQLQMTCGPATCCLLLQLRLPSSAMLW